MSSSIRPMPKPPLWVEPGAHYEIRHIAFGNFRAQCVVAESWWAIFLITADSPQLLESNYKVGSNIELARRFTEIDKVG